MIVQVQVDVDERAFAWRSSWWTDGLTLQGGDYCVASVSW